MNQIIQGDCLEVMKQFPDKHFDLCLTDPPYGIGVDYDSFDDTQENLKELVYKVMPEILRVSKVAIITCGVANIHLYPKPRWIMSWVSTAGCGSGPWGFCCWQPLLCYGKDPFLSNGLGRRPDIIMNNEASVKCGHPCPKPLGLWEKVLVRGSVNEGDLVLDPFLGSGTTCKMAKMLNRKYIGIELNPEYIEIAKNRLDGELFKEIQ